MYIKKNLNNRLKPLARTNPLLFHSRPPPRYGGIGPGCICCSRLLWDSLDSVSLVGLDVIETLLVRVASH